MAADLVLIQLPGGPYRLDITECPEGGRYFEAAEMCVCEAEDGPHWHRLPGAAPTVTDLMADLLGRFLSGVASP